MKNALQELASNLNRAKEFKITRIDSLPEKTQTQFMQARHNTLCASVSTVKSKLARLFVRAKESGSLNYEFISNMEKQINELKSEDEVSKIELIVEFLAQTISKISIDSKEPFSDFKLSLAHEISSEIRGELQTDSDELKACMNAKCYRSAVILAGRMLEVALHRKYYEATGIDLLEKAPGIGLGNLIGRLSEKNIFKDPSLSNQVHLINNVRIFSVHKKKETFRPSKSQAHAIVLYTFDIIEKIFKKELEKNQFDCS